MVLVCILITETNSVGKTRVMVSSKLSFFSLLPFFSCFSDFAFSLPEKNRQPTDTDFTHSLTHSPQPQTHMNTIFISRTMSPGRKMGKKIERENKNHATCRAVAPPCTIKTRLPPLPQNDKAS